MRQYTCQTCGRHVTQRSAAIFGGFDGVNRIYCLSCLGEFFETRTS